MPSGIGKTGEPVAEITKFGWMIMSLGQEDHSNVCLTQSTTHDYEQLHQLDVLGLTDTSDVDQHILYTEFKEQNQRSTQGWFQTALPWKPNHTTLHNNTNGSLSCLSTLLSKLQHDLDLFNEYDVKIKEQLAEGIVEKAPATTTSKEFYIPHKPVVKKSAETTKLRIVHDASSKPTKARPFLNQCLEVGPVSKIRFGMCLHDIL